ncbi:hypothetical protein [Burkholderia ubonensis]|uniref:helix-turn-helix transcriptional regulator n=1 Tax=Burkholderia ubonensis TaxID=101571 RepID=UPI002FCBD942
MSTQNTLTQFDELPDAATVDDKVVAALCSCNVSTVWDRVKKGTMPQPIKIGGSTRWNVGQLRAFLTCGDVVEMPDMYDVAKGPAGKNMIPRDRSNGSRTSLRDFLAAHALCGLLADGWCEEERVLTGNWVTIAADAYKAADAMLTARSKS